MCQLYIEMKFNSISFQFFSGKIMLKHIDDALTLRLPLEHVDGIYML